MQDNPNVDNKEIANPQGAKQESIEPTDVKQEGSKKAEHQVPYSVFKETKNQLNELKSQLSEMQDERKQAKEKKMEEEGQLKELLQEKNSVIDKQNEQLQEWSEYKTNKRKNLLEQIPEEDRIIYSDLSLDKLEAHIGKTQKTITPSTSKATSQRSAGGEFGGYNSWQEFAVKDPVGAEKALNNRSL